MSTPTGSANTDLVALLGGTGSYASAIALLGVAERTITVNVTPASTPANTNETTLATYSLPAGVLSADGKGIRITVWWSQAANGNTKTSRLKFAGTTVGSVASTGSGTFGQITATILRTGASTQTAMTHRSASSSVETTVTAPSGDTTAAITIDFTGQSGTGTAADIVFNAMVIESIN